MKTLAVFLFAAALSAQTVKPALPVADHNKQEQQTTPTGVYLYEPPCGYSYFSATKDANGVCRLTANLHFGPDYADCRFVSTEDGKVLQIVCTWKPKEAADAPPPHD